MKRIGLSGGSYSPLDSLQIEKIHQATLKVFEEVGVKVSCAEALELFEGAGAKVDREQKIVKLSPKLVEKILSTTPSDINLCGRDESGELDCAIGGKRVHLGTGGTALNVQEPGATDNRRSELKDIGSMARMVDALENIHFYMLNVYPNDLSMEDVDVNRFGAALNRTRKHVMGGVYTVEGVRNVIRMAEMIAGSPEKLRERPFISMVACVISPFVIDEHYGQLGIEAARNGIPLAVPAEPLCGATSPITLAGNLVVLNVDTLAGVMMTQLAKAGAPVLYGCVASVTDLRDMKYLAGAVEMGLINAAASQLAQFYKIPVYATAGMSDAKMNDPQSGYESAITSLLVALAGGNYIHDAAGFIEFCMTASYDKLVIDNEIIGMVMRAVQGIEVTDETIAYDLLKKAGPSGHFVSERHTRRHMRAEHYQPQLSNRESREKWQADGSKDARIRAAEKSREILGAPPVSCIPEDVRSRLKSEIPGLKPFVME